MVPRMLATNVTGERRRPTLPMRIAADDAFSPAPARDVNAGRRHLFNPWLDFLGLGGGSVIVLSLFFVLYPEDDLARGILAACMLFLANFVNHPHFANSYQLFYGDFVNKAFSPTSALRAQYRIVGILVPAALAAFYASALSVGSAPLLGLAANVMFFMVGWHYAKQGYGILMLDAARKGKPFGAAEKRHLLWNVRLAWPTYWLMTNDALAARDYWGLTYYAFDTPEPILAVMFLATAISGVVVLRDLVLKWRAEGILPVNGLVAYVVSIYVWLYFARFDPILLLLVPFFHSLQYLCVVWRYQANLEAAKLRGRPSPDGSEKGPAWARTALARLARFVLVGGILGGVGFWIAPHILDSVVGYDRAVFGATLFVFIGWTFINIHHYFIDSVIWRRDNAETRRYLLAR